MLLQVRGLRRGRFFILTIPENFDDLYHLPPEVLSQIRRDLMDDIPVYLDSPAKICLFTYDNNTFIAKSYQPFPGAIQHRHQERRGPNFSISSPAASCRVM